MDEISDLEERVGSLERAFLKFTQLEPEKPYSSFKERFYFRLRDDADVFDRDVGVDEAPPRVASFSVSYRGPAAAVALAQRLVNMLNGASTSEGS